MDETLQGEISSRIWWDKVEGGGFSSKASLLHLPPTSLISGCGRGREKGSGHRRGQRHQELRDGAVAVCVEVESLQEMLDQGEETCREAAGS